MKLATLLFAAALSASSQSLDLKLDALAAKASEKAEIDLDGAALAMAAKASAKLQGITLLRVRHYEFAAKGAYSIADLDPLRKQVKADSAWSRIVGVKEKNEEVEIFLHSAGGLLIVAAEPKELSVVQIMGELNGKLKEIVRSDIQFDLKSILAAATKPQN